MEPSHIQKSVLKHLKKICGKEGVSQADSHRIAYSRDCSTSSLIEIREGHISHPPDLIVWPQTTEQVSQVLKLAGENEIPLVPYGAGSGVCGGALPLKAGIVLDLKKMDRILSIDPERLLVTAQPGILGEILERQLKQQGLTLGHFPSSIYTATLGGYLACRSAGQLSTKYGKIEDMVRGLEVCLANGEVLSLNHDEKIDLKEIFVGSEGTLGVITEATMAIHPQPEMKKYVGVRFPILRSGLAALRKILQMGLRPAVLRLYDPLETVMFQSHTESVERPFLQNIFESLPDPLKVKLKALKSYSLKTLLSRPLWVGQVIDFSFSRSLLILGFEGPAWKVKHEWKEALEICRAQGGEDLGEEVGLQWLDRRYTISYKMSPVIDQGCFADTMEVAAPWNRLEEVYEAVRSAIEEKALVMAHFSHAYPDGCSIYFIFVGCRETEELSLKVHREIWAAGLKACLDHGGTISHHHGIGFLKAEAFVQELGPLHDWLKKTKQVLDPKGILNPGKMGL